MLDKLTRLRSSEGQPLVVVTLLVLAHAVMFRLAMYAATRSGAPGALVIVVVAVTTAVSSATLGWLRPQAHAVFALALAPLAMLIATPSLLQVFMSVVTGALSAPIALLAFSAVTAERLPHRASIGALLPGAALLSLGFARVLTVAIGVSLVCASGAIAGAIGGAGSFRRAMAYSTTFPLGVFIAVFVDPDPTANNLWPFAVVGSLAMGAAAAVAGWSVATLLRRALTARSRGAR